MVILLLDIYFDNAATTQVDPTLLQSWIELEQTYYANPSSLHQAGRKVAKQIKQARQELASFINASSEEIIFTSGATESNNSIFAGFDYDLIITTTIEHPSVLEPVKQAAKPIEWLEVNQQGYISLEQLSQLLEKHKGKKILVSIMHANNEIGTIQDLIKIGELTSQYPEVIFHSDCAQSWGKHDIDVRAAKLDAISASGHKLHAPKGIGLLYLSQRVQSQFQSVFKGGGQEFDFRSGTENLSGIILFNQATKLMADAANKQYLKELVQYFYDSMKSNSGLVLNGPDLSDRLLGNLNISFVDSKLNSEELVLQLDLAGIAVSSGSACSSNKRETGIISSYVLRACGLAETISSKAIRVSLSRFNNKTEIDYFIKIIGELARKFVLK